MAVSFTKAGMERLGRCSHPCVELHLLLEAREGLENSWDLDPWVLFHHPQGSGHSREMLDWHIHEGKKAPLGAAEASSSFAKPRLAAVEKKFGEISYIPSTCLVLWP